MAKILGLDLGTDSIRVGFSEDKSKKQKILGLGTRIFPYRVENLGDGEGGNF